MDPGTPAKPPSPPEQSSLQFRIVSGTLGWLGRLGSRPLIRRLWVYAIYALIGVVVTMMFVRNYSDPTNPEEIHRHAGEFPGPHLSGLNARVSPDGTFKGMVTGTAAKPYVNRLLMPLLIRGLTPLVPDLSDLTFSSTFQKALVEIGLDWEAELYREYLVGTCLMFLFLLGWIWSLRCLTRAVFEVPEYVVDFVGLAGLLVLPPFFELYGSYIYDFSGLCLFTFGLWAMVRERWIAFFVLYALGTINKETTVLLTFAFCMYHAFSGRMTWKTYFAFALAQSLLFLGIKFGIGILHADNPGGAVEFHLLRNLSKLPRWDFGTIAMMGIASGLVLWRWPEKSLFLRSAMIILVPLIVLTFLFGYFDEMRDYYEALPLVLLLAAHSLCRIFEVRLEVRR